jgi:hypothetical protein
MYKKAINKRLKMLRAFPKTGRATHCYLWQKRQSAEIAKGFLSYPVLIVNLIQDIPNAAMPRMHLPFSGTYL